MKKATELLAELEAEDKLRQRGYKQVPCSSCKGRRSWQWVRDGQIVDSGICNICGGTGQVWEAPLTC